MSDDLKPGEERFPAPAQLDAAGREAQKRRNLWLGLALLGFVLLVAITTFVRLGNSDMSKGGFYYQNSGSSREAPELPPGMTPEQAAPPPNLSAEPSVPEPQEAETEEPEQ
ncbi:MAG TPA: hypothetical protein PK417_02170 [Hyphomonas sp.]|nr:hypothetical protein [Hyphomonas sp.]HRX73553.1 hypothetical protein [Hyphomonas sp.]